MYPKLILHESIQIPSYFLIITLAYCLGVIYLWKRAREFEVSQSQAMDLSLIIMGCGFLGSRFLHIIYEEPGFYWEHPIEALKFWNGGFVFFGGALLAFASAWIYVKIKDQSPWIWMDVFAPIVPLVYMVGRLGTLLSGSGYGKPTNLPWGITYPMGTEAPAGMVLHPTPIYAMIWEGLTFLFIYVLEKSRKDREQGSGKLFLLMVIMHCTGRFILEQFRGDYRGPTLLTLSLSSWICLILILGVITCFRKIKKTG